MTTRLPLVLSPNGLPEQLQSGDNLPLATTGTFGVVKPDGTSITVVNGVISATGGGGGGIITPDGIEMVSTTNAAQVTGYSAQIDVTGRIVPTINGSGYLTSVYGDVLPGFASNLMLCNWTQGSQTGMDQNGQKSSQINQNVNSIWSGAGQHFLQNWSATAWGMSDAFLLSAQLNYATGPIGGDEGQAFSTGETGVFQQQFLVWAHIDAVLNTGCTVNTTTTQPIVASQLPQNIYVADLTGVHVGDWVVINQSLPTVAPNMWPVQVLATGTDMTGSFINGVCLINIGSGVTVTPAAVFVLDNKGFQVGQDRVLVNQSGPSYSVGTANQDSPKGSSAGLSGVGTSWAVNMVGGNATNIGAISFDADNYINQPFYSGGQLASSNTTHSIVGSGSLTFTIPGSFPLSPPTQVIIYDSTNYNNSMWGTVSAYSGTSLTVTIAGSTGSGSNLSAWSIFTGVITTSSTSNTIPSSFSTGSQVLNFTVGAGLAFEDFVPITIYETGNFSNFMTGVVDGYSGTTLTVRISGAGGSGTHSDWTIVAQSFGVLNGNFKSWYQINGVSSTTRLSVNVNTAIGSGAYSGNAPVTPASGGYTIKPACRVLLNLGIFTDPQGQVICESTSAVWKVGDLVECVICPYSDVNGLQLRASHWNPGAVLESFLTLLNAGARTFTYGIRLSGWGGSQIGRVGADAVAMDHAVDISSANYGVVYEPVAAATGHAFEISVNQNTNDVSNRINWGGSFGGRYIGLNTTNFGLESAWAASQGGVAVVSSYSSGLGNNPSTHLAEVEFDTYFMRLTGLNNVQDTFIEFGQHADYTGDRIQLQSALSKRGAVGQLEGLDINYVTGSGAGTATPLFSLSGASNYPMAVPTASADTYVKLDGPFAGWPANTATPTTSNTTNNSSSFLELYSTVWTGSAVLTKPMLIANIPNQGVNNAPITLSFQCLEPGASPDPTLPRTVMSIDETGTLYLGISNTAAGLFQGATINPVNIASGIHATSILSMTLPNQAGGIQVVKGATGGSLPSANTSAGTPGQVIVDTATGNLYVCYASSSGSTQAWTKITGSNSF